jgi:histidinol-phosphate aminotransferase
MIRPTVRAMSGYTPGEQPRAGERIVKLNTNENPYPPSEKVMAAIANIEPEALRRYPDPHATAFRNAAAKVLGVSPDMILAGNGSDDILTIATRTFIDAGGTLAYPDPTYSLYPILATLQDAKIKTVPWEADYALPIDALCASGAHAIYLANPNAPSGTCVTPQAIGELAGRFEGLVLIDEAYADFADQNCLSLIKTHDNVVISRTLSKGYSLAGLRFGFAIAQAPLIEQMNKVKDSYNCDAISIVAATAAIEDQEHARTHWQDVRNERARVTAGLVELGWSVIPSQANFLLATAPDGNGQAAYQGLKRQGILVRYFDLPGLTDKIRITIGASHENNALLAGLKTLASAEQAA